MSEFKQMLNELRSRKEFADHLGFERDLETIEALYTAAEAERDQAVEELRQLKAVRAITYCEWAGIDCPTRCSQCGEWLTLDGQHPAREEQP